MNTHDDERDGQSHVLAVSDEDFSARALAVEIPVIVEVGAPGCAPCRMMDPLFADLACEYQGKIRFVTLDADDSPLTTMAYGVQGLPTFLIFHNGKLVSQFSGACSRADLKRRLEQALAITTA